MEKIMWGCAHCDGNILYGLPYTQCPNGIGHKEGCPERKAELDEDFATWSDLHIGPAPEYEMDLYCIACGIDINIRCECHRKLIPYPFSHLEKK